VLDLLAQFLEPPSSFATIDHSKKDFSLVHDQRTFRGTER
jgi:hypothetical protein